MPEIAISVENLSKSFRIAHQANGARGTYKTLREDIVDLPRKLWSRGSARYFGRAESGLSSETFWALQDISFEVTQGEVVGVIGRNGAGKSTLLKILSRITEPSSGTAEIYGRVGSLLEVGTGFHQELTGRENIFMNGAVLGMSRAEIRGKFDEIVAFAEVERFLDTPVKRYSSGMFVRLAFAVAAHLEPEILIVDEVLAVGDAEFQRKCLGKMGEVAKAGRTVMFVSHNMTAINQLCSRALLLKDGKIASEGKTEQVVTAYLATAGEQSGIREWPDPTRAPGNSKVRLKSVRIVSNEEVTGEVDIDREISVEVEFWNYENNARSLCVNIYLLDQYGSVVLSTANSPRANLLDDPWYDQPKQRGLHRSTLTFPANFLNEGLHHISVYIITLGPVAIEAQAEQAISFLVSDTGVMREPGGGSRWDGAVRVRLPWRTEFIGSLTEEEITNRAILPL